MGYRCYTRTEYLTIQKIKETSNKCFYCDRHLTKEEKTIDHLHPICKGGKTTEDNLVVACSECNQEKGKMTTKEYKFYRRFRKLFIFLNRFNKTINRLLSNLLLFTPKTKTKLDIKKLQEFELTDYVIWEYRDIIKNEEEEYETIKKKLIRNIVLGNRYNGVSYYGNLKIIYNVDKKKITYIQNRKGHYPFNKIDENKKEWIEKELGLN